MKEWTIKNRITNEYDAVDAEGNPRLYTEDEAAARMSDLIRWVGDEFVLVRAAGE